MIFSAGAIGTVAGGPRVQSQATQSRRRLEVACDSKVQSQATRSRRRPKDSVACDSKAQSQATRSRRRPEVAGDSKAQSHATKRCSRRRHVNSVAGDSKMKSQAIRRSWLLRLKILCKPKKVYVPVTYNILLKLVWKSAKIADATNNCEVNQEKLFFLIFWTVLAEFSVHKCVFYATP